MAVNMDGNTKEPSESTTTSVTTEVVPPVSSMIVENGGAAVGKEPDAASAPAVAAAVPAITTTLATTPAGIKKPVTVQAQDASFVATTTANTTTAAPTSTVAPAPVVSTTPASVTTSTTKTTATVPSSASIAAPAPSTAAASPPVITPPTPSASLASKKRRGSNSTSGSAKKKRTSSSSRQRQQQQKKANRASNSSSDAEEIEEESAYDDSNGVIACICDFKDDDGFMIQCETCDVWLHSRCFNISEDNVPDQFFCTNCKPREVDREAANRAQRLRQQKEREQRERRIQQRQRQRSNSNNSLTTPSPGVADGVHGSTAENGSSAASSMQDGSYGDYADAEPPKKLSREEKKWMHLMERLKKMEAKEKRQKNMNANTAGGDDSTSASGSVTPQKPKSRKPSLGVAASDLNKNQSDGSDNETSSTSPTTPSSAQHKRLRTKAAAAAAAAAGSTTPSMTGGASGQPSPIQQQRKGSKPFIQRGPGSRGNSTEDLLEDTPSRKHSESPVDVGSPYASTPTKEEYKLPLTTSTPLKGKKAWLKGWKPEDNVKEEKSPDEKSSTFLGLKKMARNLNTSEEFMKKPSNNNSNTTSVNHSTTPTISLEAMIAMAQNLASNSSDAAKATTLSATLTTTTSNLPLPPTSIDDAAKSIPTLNLPVGEVDGGVVITGMSNSSTPTPGPGPSIGSVESSPRDSTGSATPTTTTPTVEESPTPKTRMSLRDYKKRRATSPTSSPLPHHVITADQLFPEQGQQQHQPLQSQSQQAQPQPPSQSHTSLHEPVFPATTGNAYTATDTKTTSLPLVNNDTASEVGGKFGVAKFAVRSSPSPVASLFPTKPASSTTITTPSSTTTTTTSSSGIAIFPTASPIHLSSSGMMASASPPLKPYTAMDHGGAIIAPIPMTAVYGSGSNGSNTSEGIGISAGTGLSSISILPTVAPAHLPLAAAASPMMMNGNPESAFEPISPSRSPEESSPPTTIAPVPTLRTAPAPASSMVTLPNTYDEMDMDVDMDAKSPTPPLSHFKIVETAALPSKLKTEYLDGDAYTPLIPTGVTSTAKPVDISTPTTTNTPPYGSNNNNNSSNSGMPVGVGVYSPLPHTAYTVNPMMYGNNGTVAQYTIGKAPPPPPHGVVGMTGYGVPPPRHAPPPPPPPSHPYGAYPMVSLAPPPPGMNAYYSLPPNSTYPTTTATTTTPALPSNTPTTATTTTYPPAPTTTTTTSTYNY